MVGLIGEQELVPACEFLVRSSCRILAAMTDSRRPVPSQQTRPADPLPRDTSGNERWVDLHDAGELTGIPASTIRNWARKRRIDSRFELDETGDRRYVELSEVIAWADHLGRQHSRVASRESRVASDEVASRELRVASREVDASVPEAEASDEDKIQAQSTKPVEEAPTRDEQPATSHPESQTNASQQLAPEVPEVPEGTMLVPLDAWNKMLNQLGNLHEAGQQLADARERAAKAETEVVFLRERLAELREHTTADKSDPVDDSQTAEASGFDPLWVDLYRRWNRRRAR